MNDFEMKDLKGTDINPIIKSYRDAAKQMYDNNVSNINQARQNSQTSIMSKANQAGVLHSNFPQRLKMQYDAQTYLPSLAKANDTYQTGLQKIRMSAVDAYNNIKGIQDQIKYLNEKGRNSGSGDPDTVLDSRSKMFYGSPDGKDPNTYYFYYDGKPIRAWNFAKKNNIDFNKFLLGLANREDYKAKYAVDALGRAFNGHGKNLSPEELNAFQSLGIPLDGWNY